MNKGSDPKAFFEVFNKPQHAKENTGKQEDNRQKNDPKMSEKPEDAPPRQETIKKNNEEKEMPATEVNTKTNDPLKWIKNTYTEDITAKERKEVSAKSETVVHKKPINEGKTQGPVLRKDEVILRQETLIIGAIAATFLSVACFFVGHKVGYNKGVTHQAEEWLETIEPQDSEKKDSKHTSSDEASTKETNEQNQQKQKILTIKPESSIKDTWTLRVVSYRNTKAAIKKAKEVAKKLQDRLGYNAFVVNTGKNLFVCIGEFESNNSTDLLDIQKAVAAFEYENKKQFTGCYPIRMR